MPKNDLLHTAKQAKCDEFFTTYEDIHKEVNAYTSHFIGKCVYCNCDNIYHSNFAKYFIINFARLNLKRLICTAYDDSRIVGTQLSLFGDDEAVTTGYGYLLDITSQEQADHCIQSGVFDYVQRLKENGDFRSYECVELLKQADIIVTNPPFSLFLDFMGLLFHNNKSFIIMGNINAITNKLLFDEFKNGRLHFGESIRGGDRKFIIPPEYPLQAYGCGIDTEGNRFVRVKGVRWYTNLPSTKKRSGITMYKSYKPEYFPVYDDYDAINVDRTEDIPFDYDGIMGVPISFLDKYIPTQFELIDIRRLHLAGRELYQRVLIRRKKVHN